MKILSWNIRDLRGHNWDRTRSLTYIFTELKPDIVCLQEVKINCNDSSVIDNLNRYAKSIGYTVHAYSFGGYSGLLTFIKDTPECKYTIWSFDLKGIVGYDKYNVNRIMSLLNEDTKTCIINTYIPNAGTGLCRLEFKEIWMKKFSEFIWNVKFKYNANVIIAGDVNVVPTEKCLANFKSNYNKTPGCTKVEIDCYNSLLNTLGMFDVARHYEDYRYTFWSSRRPTNRERNIGWRLDHFWLSNELENNLNSYDVLSDLKSSDHCPILLELI